MWMQFQLLSCVALLLLHVLRDDTQCNQNSKLSYPANKLVIFQRDLPE